MMKAFIQCSYLARLTTVPSVKVLWCPLSGIYPVQRLARHRLMGRRRVGLRKHRVNLVVQVARASKSPELRNQPELICRIPTWPYD